MADYEYVDETPFAPPAGIRPGVLPRDDQFGDSCPLLRSAPGFRMIPRNEWNSWLDAKNNLSGKVWSVFNQGQVGSCASESVDGALKIVREACGLPRIEFNPLGTYGRVNGGTDSGSTLQANLKFLRDYGAFPESIWPRSKGWRARPSEEAYAAARKYRIDEFYEVGGWDEFASALLAGWAVYWGYSGHAIVGVDLVNDQQFRYLNSWGQWGSGTPYSEMQYGFGVINRSRILWGYGVYAFRSPVVEV